MLANASGLLSWGAGAGPQELPKASGPTAPPETLNCLHHRVPRKAGKEVEKGNLRTDSVTKIRGQETQRTDCWEAARTNQAD